ncbi:MAG: hypothetical protein IT569_00590 [Leptospiraceae bacterium]|nr:hypothetical protein [Leptospiraceae bacterium]
MNALDLKNYLNEFPENVLRELIIKNDTLISLEFSLNEILKSDEILSIIEKLRAINA